MNSIQRSVRSALGGLGATSTAQTTGRATVSIPAVTPWGTTTHGGSMQYTAPTSPPPPTNTRDLVTTMYTPDGQQRDVVTSMYTPPGNYRGNTPDRVYPGTPPGGSAPGTVVVASPVWPSPNSCTSPCGPTECRGLPWQWWAGMHNGR